MSDEKQGELVVEGKATMERLEAAEAVLRSGFQDVARALVEILDQKLYLAADYPNFVTYCNDRVHYQKSMAYSIVAAGRVLPLIEDETVRREITSERLVRPIAKMRAHNQAKCLDMVVKVARKNGLKITSDLVEEVARRNFGWVPERERKRKAESDDPRQEVYATMTLAFRSIAELGMTGYDAVQEFGSPHEWPDFLQAYQFLKDAADAPEPESGK